MSSHQPTRRAFTLIELLVVIAIITLLAAILFPVFARARENARRTSCTSNMKQMGLGLQMYVQDNDGRYPMSSGAGKWADYIYPYVKSTQLFTCPSTSVPAAQKRSWAPAVSGVPASTEGYYGYGFNYQYLGNSRTPARDGFPFTATDSVVTAPAQTVAIADTKGTPDFTTSDGNYVVDPPEPVTYMDNSARGSGRDDISFGYYKNNCAGGAVDCRATPANRHLEMVSVAFADGHAKAMKPEKLDDFDNDGSPDNGYFNGRGVADDKFYY